ncbi:hypothetical protein G6O67_003522 [Ophiocordyceps sinensis]|uniref:BTB domain-containing protein n=1 Tax=Ophiocordyceps sinensis TaxID=72228 RepID=A0A8H4V639_9HYPO|nr:hypothetical protein G6O67_003522 [Ophiocordyceps sinensis]
MATDLFTMDNALTKEAQPIVMDPDGDVLFILRNANAPFASCVAFKPWLDLLPNYRSPVLLPDKGIDLTMPKPLSATLQSSTPAQVSTEAAEQSVPNPPEIRMKLSSKHLMLASSYFKKMMTNQWKEADKNTAPGYSYVVSATDWDAQALTILMRVIHGRTALVPRTIELELLAKIAVLVDYYDCFEAVAIFSETWNRNLDRTEDGDPYEDEDLYEDLHYSKDTLLRLFVSWCFGPKDVLCRLKDVILN